MQERCNLLTSQCSVRPASYKNVKHWATARLQSGIKAKNVNTSGNLLSYRAWKENMGIERNAQSRCTVLGEMKARTVDNEPSVSRSAATMPMWAVKNWTFIFFGLLEALLLKTCTFVHTTRASDTYPREAPWWIWLQNAIRLHLTKQVPNYTHAS